MSISKSYSAASSEDDLSRVNSVEEIETSEVEKFLTAVYAQQLKEKHTKIVKSRSGMMRGSRVETAVVPIISSAVNIRDHYIRQLRHMD